MNELIVIDDQRMTSMQIAELTGKLHHHVMRDIRTLIDQGAITDTNFGCSEYKDASGKSNPMFSLDFHATMVLITGYDAVKRSTVLSRWEFLERERRQQHVPVTIPTHAEALRLAADMVEKNEALQKQIEADRPKTIFADAVSVSSTEILIRELAKILNQNGIDIGQNRLFEWLRNNGYLIKREGRDRSMPTQRAMDLGLFRVTERPFINPKGDVLITKTVLVTGKGQLYFVNKFIEERDRQKVA